ncbi:hypothetical protein TSOC_008248 [Tetrabaena socialis]|uniref:Uncharacterized protein n=1 Tax=Tetrabaena socialis TaxID=47790 RepID=A0A2J7ZZ05_9CHLO|nr:hypothetical protein TSOC_008248 [Tetrabaena socialis]|eukprot:PNH05478.1 hypothetical protein TSOC_008248 [Tetrabaena socialis]
MKLKGAFERTGAGPLRLPPALALALLALSGAGRDAPAGLAGDLGRRSPFFCGRETERLGGSSAGGQQHSAQRTVQLSGGWSGGRALCLRPALASDIRLRNGTLTASPSVCVPGANVSSARSAALFAAALSGSGQTARAEYAQARAARAGAGAAYLCEDGVSLCGGLPVLEASGGGWLDERRLGRRAAVGPASYAIIEANNSYLILNETSTYLKSMELRMVENNTLAFGGGNVTLDYSTISLASRNWFSVANGTDLAFNVSRLNFTNYFAWYVHSDLKSPPPPLYENKTAPLVWVNDSTLAAEGTLIVFSNLPAVVLTNSSLLLSNSTLQLYNSTLQLWDSSLGLVNSAVELYDGSVLEFYCNSTAVGEGRVAAASLSKGKFPAGAQQLGSKALSVIDEPYGDLALTAVGMAFAAEPTNAYGFSAPQYEQERGLSAYNGKVIVAMNIASE